MAIQREAFRNYKDRVDVSMHLNHVDAMTLAKGEVFVVVQSPDQPDCVYHYQNVITLDASILAATLFRDPSSRDYGVYMLAVGSGATGALLSPNAPDPRQRKLNAELARKPFSSTTFRDSNGNAVAIPTNIVDFTCTFDEGEAAGPLNEMGLISPISGNPSTTNSNPNNFPTRDVTLDLSLYDILVNYLTFAVMTIPNTARFSVTWRITF
jgi:hypothetical protein